MSVWANINPRYDRVIDRDHIVEIQGTDYTVSVKEFHEIDIICHLVVFRLGRTEGNAVLFLVTNNHYTDERARAFPCLR